MTPGKVLLGGGAAVTLIGVGCALYFSGKVVGAGEMRGEMELTIHRMEKRLLALNSEVERLRTAREDANEDLRADYIRLRKDYLKLRDGIGKPLTAEERASMRWRDRLYWGLEEDGP